MRAPRFYLAAFTTQPGAGNPAAVVVLAHWVPDARLQAIAADHNLSETAFLMRQDQDYHIRWFTPTIEVPLCGHATLASAAVVMERLEPGRQTITFHSASGPLPVRRTARGYAMDFPARAWTPVPPPPGLISALGVVPSAVIADAVNYIAVFDDPQLVRELAPDLAAISRLDRQGVVLTAPGDGGYDMVSRYFAPAKGIPEDPVTGGAHCALAPYWAVRLGKPVLHAYQASQRGGELWCRVRDNRVELEGACVVDREGMVTV